MYYYSIVSFGRHVDKSGMYSISQDNQITSLDWKESFKDLVVSLTKK